MKKKRIPVICIDENSVAGAKIFNPNEWDGPSKPIIHTCWAEYTSLVHSASEIEKVCINATQICSSHIQRMQEQWNRKPFDLSQVELFSHVPAMHSYAESFFSGTKSLMDLLAQLISSENIVSGTVIHGFHKKNKVCGGDVLNALENNAATEKKEWAQKIRELILQAKKIWIDQCIGFRDGFIHPEKGMFQIMFRLEFLEKDGKISWEKPTPPSVGEDSINTFVSKKLTHIQQFSTDFLKLLKEAGKPAP